MPKRKAAAPAPETPANDGDAGNAEDTKEAEPAAKVANSAEPKKRGRGRPPMTEEAKLKKEEKKAQSSGRGRGRPKGTTKKSPKKK